MTLRAEKLLARAWQRTQSRRLQREGFLEDALAAALEHPAVWPQLVRHLGWHERLPQTTPSIHTQQSGTFGRTDIELDWPDHGSPTLVLELKVQAPPTSAQVGAYLIRDDILLVGIGAWSNTEELRAELPDDQTERLLDVMTWAQLRQLAWDGAPLELRQLHYLLDAMGVTMPRADEQQLRGLVASLSLWPLLDSWIPAGLSAVRVVCISAGVTVARPDGPHLKNGWYAGWLSGRSVIPVELALWGGLILQDALYPSLSGGFPDLVLQLEIDSRSLLSQRLQEDNTFRRAVRSWIVAAPETEARVDHRAPENVDYRVLDEWVVLSVRTSGAILLRSTDQRQTFVNWLQASATTLAEHGILGRIAALAQASAAGDLPHEE